MKPRPRGPSGDRIYRPRIHDSEPKTEEQRTASKRALFALVMISIVLLCAVAAPFAKALFLAAVLGGALYPLVGVLTRKLRLKRRSLAAGLTVFAVVLVLLAPLSALAAFAIGEASKAVQFVAETVRSEGMTGLIDRLPDVGRPRGALGHRQVAIETGTLGQTLGTQAGRAATAVGGALSATGSFLFQSAMMLIAPLRVAGRGSPAGQLARADFPARTRPVHRALRRVPAHHGRGDGLIGGNGGVQALAALVGYLIARVPYPLFFTALTFFVALVPAVGAASVCIAAALLLLATGHTLAAAFLAVWAVVVVGLIDNIVKPIFAKRGTDLNGVVVFFALIGGLASFGAPGLLIGPLAVALFLTVVRIWRRSYGQGSGGEPPEHLARSTS